MWSNLVLGAWIFVAPWVLRYSLLAARTVDHAVGLAVVAVALLAAATGAARLRYVHAGLGAGLVLAPFILGYGRSPATLNDIVAGCGLMLFALVARYPARSRAT